LRNRPRKSRPRKKRQERRQRKKHERKSFARTRKNGKHVKRKLKRPLKLRLLLVWQHSNRLQRRRALLLLRNSSSSNSCKPKLPRLLVQPRLGRNQTLHVHPPRLRAYLNRLPLELLLKDRPPKPPLLATLQASAPLRPTMRCDRTLLPLLCRVSRAFPAHRVVHLKCCHHSKCSNHKLLRPT